MPNGKIKQVTHFALQTSIPSAQLVPSHNDAGYGLIVGEDDKKVYFPHDAVEECAFDELWEGQEVRYELDGDSEDRAKSVAPLHDDAEPGRAGVKNPPPPEDRS